MAARRIAALSYAINALAGSNSPIRLGGKQFRDLPVPPRVLVIEETVG
ncbi:MAG: hypothetical protein AB1714_17645 [Acidobacteriota bacterium]